MRRRAGRSQAALGRGRAPTPPAVPRGRRPARRRAAIVTCTGSSPDVESRHQAARRPVKNASNSAVDFRSMSAGTSGPPSWPPRYESSDLSCHRTPEAHTQWWKPFPPLSGGRLGTWIHRFARPFGRRQLLQSYASLAIALINNAEGEHAEARRWATTAHEQASHAAKDQQSASPKWLALRASGPIRIPGTALWIESSSQAGHIVRRARELRRRPVA
jgi:hypothetical protein